MFETFFVVVSGCVVVCSFLVIALKNPVYSVLFLILTFFTVSFILFLFEIEFLPFIFIVVYVGAVAVLFLFVVMMLDLKSTVKASNNLQFLAVSVVLGLIFVAKVTYALEANLFIFYLPYQIDPLITHKYKKRVPFRLPEECIASVFVNWIDSLDNLSDLQCFGQFLYTYFFTHFLMAGFLLLLAIVSAIALTSRVEVGVSGQIAYKQIARHTPNASFLIPGGYGSITACIASIRANRFVLNCY